MKSLFGFTTEALDQTAQAALHGVSDPSKITEALREGLMLPYKGGYLCAPISELVTDSVEPREEGGFERMGHWMYYVASLARISLRAEHIVAESEPSPVTREFGNPHATVLAEPTAVAVVEVAPAKVAEVAVNPTIAPTRDTKPRLELPRCLDVLRVTFNEMLDAGTELPLVREIAARGASAMELQREDVFIDLVQRYWAKVKERGVTVSKTVNQLNTRLDKELTGTTDPAMQKLVETIMENCTSGMRKQLRVKIDNWLDKGMGRTLKYAWDQAHESGADHPVRYTQSIMELEEKAQDAAKVREAARMTEAEIAAVIEPFINKHAWDVETRTKVVMERYMKTGVIDVSHFMTVMWDPGGMASHYANQSDGNISIDRELKRWGITPNGYGISAYENLAGKWRQYWHNITATYAAMKKPTCLVRTRDQMEAALNSACRNWLQWVMDGKTRFCEFQSNMDEARIMRIVPYMYLNPFFKQIIEFWLDKHPDTPLNREKVETAAKECAEGVSVDAA